MRSRARPELGKSVFANRDYVPPLRKIAPDPLSAIRVFSSGGMATVTATPKVVTWDSVDKASGGFLAPNTATFTTISTPFPGWYMIHCMVDWAFAAGGLRRAEFVVDTVSTDMATVTAAGGVDDRICTSTIQHLTTGQAVGLTVFQNSGGNLATGPGLYSTSMTLTYLGLAS